METQAKIVIIGAGIVGCSTAYHLSKLGWKDIVVIDQGKRPFYGGSSSHAPGGMFQTNPSKLMCELANYSVHLYENLQFDGKAGAVLSGGIELATTPERMNELKRRCTLGKSWGLDGSILNPQECLEKVPYIDPDRVLGGYFVPDDGVGRPVVCVQAMAEFAQNSGSTKFYDEVQVLDIQVKNKHVEAVVTDKGTIQCEMVLCCAGFWGPLIGEMVNQPIPLVPVEHQYCITEDLKAFESIGSEEVILPMMREQDSALYFRQHNQRLGIGNYNHRNIPVDPRHIKSPAMAKTMPSVHDFTPKDFETCWARTQELFPMLKNENPSFSYQINGIFSFTPDMGSYLGESMVTRGFWVAEAIWYLHAGGFGKVISEWMDSGEAQQDVHEADINRIYKHNSSPKYVWNRSQEQYRIVYDVSHPKRQMLTSRNVARSLLYEKQKALGAKFFDTLGFERAQWYQSNEKLLTPQFSRRRPWLDVNWSPIEAVEAFYTRNHAALYELSAFQILEVSGKNALEFLQFHCCSNVDVQVGRIVYTHLMTKTGGIKSDITIARMDEETFWVVSGVASAGHDFATLFFRKGEQEGITLRNISDEYATLGLWGPKAKKIASALSSISLEISDFPFFRWKEAFFDEIPVVLFRISYVGESGWEIYTKPQYANALWEKLEEAGKEDKLIPAGMGAFDSLRLEKGYRSWGADMAQNENPFEAGTAFVIHWKKGNFLGREALEKVKENGVSIKLCTFRLENTDTMLQGGETAYDASGKRIGYITSANFSYTFEFPIGYAYLDASYAEENTSFFAEYLGQKVQAFVTADVLYDPKYQQIKL